MRVARVLGPLVYTFASIPASIAAPLRALDDGGLEPKPADNPGLWVYLGTALVLVLLGGVFAGLTIAYVPLFAPSLARIWLSIHRLVGV